MGFEQSRGHDQRSDVSERLSFLMAPGEGKGKLDIYEVTHRAELSGS